MGTKKRHPKVFGKRPILMMRYDGGLRIIYPRGTVQWVSYDGGSWDGYACTTSRNQKKAYEKCVRFDAPPVAPSGYSAFLGYL